MSGFDRKCLLVVLLIALALRLAWAISRPTDDQSLSALPDQQEYLSIARSILAGDGLGFTDPRFNQRVAAYRTPGYPLFAAAFGANVRIVRIAQAILDTSTVLAAYLLARRWLSPMSGVMAAVFVAFNPFLIYFCGLLLTETLFTALLAWGMVLMTSARTRAWLIGGVLLAISILVRPGAIALPVVLGVLAAMSNRPADGAYHRRWPLPVGSTMLLLTLLVLFPWAMRNHRVVERWVWTSTNAGITRFDGFNPDATGASDQRFVESMPQLRRMSEIERDHYLSDQADQFIHSHPIAALKLAAAKVARTWSPVPLSSEFSRPLYVAAAMGFAIPFGLFVLVGLVCGRLPLPAKLLLLAPAVYLTATVAASVGSLRYRIPAEVPMAVIAAAGVQWAIGSRKAVPVLPLDDASLDASLDAPRPAAD